MFFQNTYIYLKISPGQVVGKSLRSGASETVKCSALNHPRTLMGDFLEIEKCFKNIVRKLQGKSFLFGAPIIVVHLPPSPEGGYTNVEARAFREAAYGAGAKAVLVPNPDYPLSESQIKNEEFKSLDVA